MALVGRSNFCLGIAPLGKRGRRGGSWMTCWKFVGIGGGCCEESGVDRGGGKKSLKTLCSSLDIVES